MHQLIWAVAGPMIWAAHFSLMYGTQTVICTHGLGIATVHLVPATIALTAVAAVALVMVIGRRLATTRRHEVQETAPSQPFLGHLQIALAALSLLAVIWSALPAAALQACAPSTS